MNDLKYQMGMAQLALDEQRYQERINRVGMAQGDPEMWQAMTFSPFAAYPARFYFGGKGMHGTGDGTAATGKRP